MPQNRAVGAAALRRALSQSRWLILCAGLFSAAVNLLMLSGPIYMLQVYDRVLASRSEPTLAALSLLMVFLYAHMAVLDHARARTMARVGARLQARLDSRVLQAMVARQIAAPEDVAGQSATRDLEALQRFLASPLPIALFDIPWSPVFAATIFLFHPWLGWLALSGAAVLIAIAGVNQLLTFAAAGRAGAAAMAAERMAAEMRAEAGPLRGLGMEAAATGRWLKMRHAALEGQIALSDRMAGFAALSRGFRLALQSAMLGLGALVVLRGEMSGGAMIAGSVLLGRALQPVEVAISQWGTFLQAREGWRRLSALISRVPGERPRMALPRPQAALEVQGLTVVPPGEDRAALRATSFSLGPGQALAVIGPSGAGKSTLARALTGIWPARAGAIRLGGAWIGQYPPDQFGALIGYLPQRVQLFAGTVAENIARLRPDAAPDRVIAAARLAGIHEAILALPRGYDTQTGPLGDPFSGGQIQQIGLARALYGDPVLLVLDEPNSNLDRAGALALNVAIRAMKARGAAAVVMTHRSAAIEACDVLLLLEAGQVRGFGPREQMMRAMLRAAPGPRPAPAAAPTAGEDARHGEDTVPMFRAAPRPVPGRAGGGQ